MQKALRLVLLFLVSLLVLVPRSAMAHAVLQKSSPVAGSHLDAGIVPVSLTYNSRIDAAHSTLSIVDAAGKEMPLQVDTQADPNILRSAGVALKSGHYTLHWQVLARDGHITRGTIPFDVQ